MAVHKIHPPFSGRFKSAPAPQDPAESADRSSGMLSIRGARTHNLKSIDVTIPRGRLVVITGLSGSGKSSLAFDTVYAEGQRRYVESLSAYARQFLEMVEKPDVDQIEGLSPAIAVDQKNVSHNPRSTVGTVTEIQDYLRLLFARVGVPYSPATGLPITSQTVTQMVDAMMARPPGTRLLLLSPVVRNRKGEFRKDLEDLLRQGFQRVKIDGALYETDDPPTLDRHRNHDIEVVVDRIVIREGLESRLADSTETALRLSDGLLITEDADSSERVTFSARFACPVSGFTIDEIEPRLFSFNSPSGWCNRCGGIGVVEFFDPDLIIPNPKLTLRAGAIEPWEVPPSGYYLQALEGMARHFGFSLDRPWSRLPKFVRETILHGSGTTDVAIQYGDTATARTLTRPFPGVVPSLEKRWQEASEPSVREQLGSYRAKVRCHACQGHRLRTEALAVRIGERHVGTVSEMTIADAKAWVDDELPNTLDAQSRTIAERTLRELSLRLGFLMDVGLEYLTLARGSATLSGGESQRIRLASQIGSGLTGVLYVLDEPSIGLHQKDNARLLETLKNLRDLGNTVLVVEHDEDSILAADFVVDMGPGAGETGGYVVATGTPQDLKAHADSLTGQYLSGERTIPVPENRRLPVPERTLSLRDINTNNLRNVEVDVPAGLLICVTGVSGSGKSSLVLDTLHPLLRSSLAHPDRQDERIRGSWLFDKVIDIDQSPIGRTPRSNPATYTGAFGPIRDWFTQLPEARARGYRPGRFSFNVKGGRCEACQGDGVIKIEMHFLAPVYVTCDACKGRRYNRETLEIRYRDHSIADVLDMDVTSAAQFFAAIPTIRDKLETLRRVGLGYVRLGQRATTLSGGEAQRVKLSKELSRRATGRTLYLLDEPTTGLHFEDVRSLLQVLHALVDQGNTVLVIEHHLDVIKQADWIIDLGPEGGAGGGQVVAQGSPETVMQAPGSYTGQFLRTKLAPV